MATLFGAHFDLLLPLLACLSFSGCRAKTAALCVYFYMFFSHIIFETCLEVAALKYIGPVAVTTAAAAVYLGYTLSTPSSTDTHLQHLWLCFKILEE